MKRVFIIQNTPLNEPLPLSIYLTGLLSNFKSDDKFEINLIVAKSKSISTNIKNICNTIFQIKSSTYSIKDNIKFSLKVSSILKKENLLKKIDIVHCLYPNSSLMGAVLFKILNNRKLNLIYDVRSPWIDMSIQRGFINSYFSEIFRKLVYLQEKILCKCVDKFIFISEGLKKYYSQNISMNKYQKVFISPSGVDLNLFKRVKTNIRQIHGVKKDEVLIGSVGGIAKVRKLNEFLHLFKDLVTKNKKVKLMFVGGGDDLINLKQLTKKLNLESYVIFTGQVEHKEVPKYISAFDYGLSHIPNIFIYENSFPLKVLEYLACGVPVLASELKAHREISKQLKGIYVYRNSDDILGFIKTTRTLIKQDMSRWDWVYLANLYKNNWEFL